MNDITIVENKKGKILLKQTSGLPLGGLRLLLECGLTEIPINAALRKRIRGAFRNAQIILTAENSNRKLIGLASALTDYSTHCFVSTLAVQPAWQGFGVGTTLLKRVHSIAGGENQVNLVLHSLPAAEAFYRKSGMFPATGFMTLPRMDQQPYAPERLGNVGSRSRNPT